MSDIPKLDIAKLAQNSGLIVGNNNNTVLDYMSGQPLDFQGGYTDKYDSGLLPGIDGDEQRATRQTVGSRIANAVPRMAGRFASEIAKMPGSLAGLGMYAIDKLQNGEEANFGENINNAWVQLMEGIAESANEKFQVYTPKAVQDGNLWDNITSSSFWANEGADGVGFLLSFLVPGALLGKMGAVGSGMNQLGRIGNLARAAKLGTTTAKNIELGSIATLNALFEASAEAAGSYENIYEHLKESEASKVQSDPNYTPLTEEELRIKAGNASLGVFNSNMGILLGPNIIQAKALFGSAKSKGINKSLYEMISDPKSKSTLAKLPTMSGREKVGAYLKEIGRQGLSEGFWEEGMQFAAEKYFENIANRDYMDTDSWWQNALLHGGGIFQTYMEEIGNVDMQKGIFLGTVLGTPFGLIKARRDTQAQEKRDKGIVKSLRENYNALSGKLDIYETVTDSTGKTTVKLDTEGNPTIDEVKLLKLSQEMQDIEDVLALKDASELAGDEDNRILFLKELGSKFAIPYLNDSSSMGMEFMNRHINEIFDMNNVPESDRGIINAHIENLKQIHKKSQSFVNSLKFKSLPKTTTADAVREHIGNNMTMLTSRLNGLTEARESYAKKLVDLENNPNINKETDPEYNEVKSAYDSYTSVIERLSEELKTLRTTPADTLMKQVEGEMLLEKFRNWAKDSSTSKDVDEDIKDLTTEASNYVKDNPDLTEEEQTELSGQIEALTKEANELKDSLDKNEKLTVDELDQGYERLKNLYTQMKDLGKVNDDRFKKSMEALDKYYKMKKGVISSQGLTGSKGRLFMNMNYLTSLYHRNSKEGQEQQLFLNKLIKEVPEAQLLKDIKLRVKKNTFPKTEKPATDNSNFVVTSPEFEYQVFYKDTMIGILPEVTMYKTVTGAYLYELVMDDKFTEEKLREITGIPDLNKSLLEKTMMGQLNLMTRVTELLEGKPEGEVVELSYSDFEIAIKQGRFSKVSKESSNLPSLSDLFENFGPESKYVVINISTNYSTGENRVFTTPVKHPEAGRRKKGDPTVAELNKQAHEVITSTRDVMDKSLGSYLLMVIDPAGNTSVVAIKSPVMEPGQRKTLFDRIFKRAEQTKKENLLDTKDSKGRPEMNSTAYNKEFNTELRGKVFISSPVPMSEMSLEVTPWGTVQIKLEILQPGNKKSLIDIRDVELQENETPELALARVVKSFRNLDKTQKDYLASGFTSGSVIRQPYPQRENIPFDSISNFIPSVSADIREGRNLMMSFKGRPTEKKKEDSLPPDRNNVTKKEYEQSLGIVTAVAKLSGFEVRDYIKQIAEGKKPKFWEKNKPHVDKILRYESQPASENALYKENKNKILEFKRKNQNRLVVSETEVDTYTDGKGNFWKRVTSLFPLRKPVEDSDMRHASRGTIADDLLRGMIDGGIKDFKEFQDSYNNHELKLNSFPFVKNSLQELYDIYKSVISYAESLDLELITNVPTLQGKLIVNGVEHKVAGTIDLLGISRKTGKVSIIDLKTSAKKKTRREVYKDSSDTTKSSDLFQQSSYAELMIQDMGIEPSRTLILPIQVMMVDETVTHFVHNKGENGEFTMELEGVSPYLTKEKKQEKKPEKPEKKEDGTDLDDLIEDLSFMDWVSGTKVPEKLYNSAKSYLTKVDSKGGIQKFALQTKTSLALVAKRVKAAQFVENEYNKNLPSDNDQAPFKLSDNLSKGEKVNTGKIRKALSRILPSGIRVEFVENFLNRFPDMENALGYYFDKLITLKEFNEPGVEYHEAFHAVLRSVISDEHIAELFREAKEKYGQPTLMELKQFGESRKLMHLDADTREILWLEEKMADEYQAYQLKRDSQNIFRRTFDDIIDWVNSLLGNKSEIEKIFKDISKGRFVKAQFVNNVFNEYESSLGINSGLKLITARRTVSGTEKLNAVESEALLNRAVYFVNDRLNNKVKLDRAIEEVLTDLSNLYDIEQYIQRVGEENIREDTDFERMMRLHSAVNNADGYIELTEEIKKRLALFNLKEAMSEESEEMVEDDEGKRSFDQRAENIGGFGSLSKWLRQYIGFTVREEQDEFGNTELKEGVPMIVPLDVNKVYNGILRAASNQPSEEKFIQRLRTFAKENEESGKFIQRFFDDVGISDSNLPTKNKHIFQQVVKQMNQYKVNYKFVRIDPNSSNLSTLKVSNANMHDVDTVQVGNWNNMFMNSEDRREGFLGSLMEIKQIFSEIEVAVKNNDYDIDGLEQDVEDIHNYFNKDNIMSISKGYVRYTVYSMITEESDLYSEESVRDYINSFPEVEPIESKDLLYFIDEIYNFKRSPFQYQDKISEVATVTTPEGVESEGTDNIVEDEGKDDRTGAVGNARKIARNNAIFDETVGSTSFQNAEGETVYAHQLPTYHLVMIAELRDKDKLDQLSNDPFLSKNRILATEETRSAFINGEFFRLDGIRAEQTDKLGRLNTFVEQKKGVTYKKMTPREFSISLLALAYKERNRTGSQPSLIRLLESSSTADFMSMPIVQDAYRSTENRKVRKSVRSEFINRIETEFERIKRVKQEIDDWNSPAKKRPKGGLIKGYHTGESYEQSVDKLLRTDRKSFRGLKFDKVDNLLSENVKNKLIQAAMDGKNFREMIMAEQEGKVTYTDFGRELDDMLHDSLEAEFRGFLQTLEEDGIIRYDDKGEIMDTMLPSEMLEGDPINELGELFFTDWVNTIAINELLLGDEAVGIKDAVDAIKRAKGANASGPSVFHTGTSTLPKFENLPMAVFKEPIGSTKYNPETEIADGQGYMSVKAWKNVMHGLGKMTKEAEEFFEKVENGTVEDSDVFGDYMTSGSISGKYQMNSLKLVYYDGKRYIKLSVVPLTKQLTSDPIIVNDRITGWKAKPTMQKLHDLRESMDNYRHATDPLMDGVSMTIPESASKLMTADVTDPEKGEGLIFNNTDTRFWRLQLENPSNKKQIRDPSQMVHLIDSELNEGKETKKKYEEILKKYSEDSFAVRFNDFIQTTRSVFSPIDINKSFEESIKSNSVTPKLGEFLKHAVETLEASGAESRMLQYFTPNPDGSYMFNLNSPVTINKFAELFINYFSEGSLGKKIPGYSLAMMSGYGVEILEAPDGNIIENYDEELHSIDVDNPGKVKLVKRRLAHNKFDEKRGIYYSEFLMPAHFREFLGLRVGQEIPEELAYMFGVRIPSQDKHSAINLKLVGFMPSYMGSTGIFPDEIVSLSGSDFDIDKLYIHRPEHFRLPNGDIRRYGNYDGVRPDDLDGYRYSEFIHYKVNNDKRFRRKYREFLNSYIENDPEYNELIQLVGSLEDDINNLDEQLDDIAEFGGNNFKEILNLKRELVDRKKLNSKTLREKKNYYSNLATYDALGFFSYPLDSDEYRKQGKELNNGVLFNNILDRKMELYSAPSLEEARNTPATMEVFDEIFKDKELAGLFETPQYKQTDNMFGKGKAYRNNREGAQNIGPAVNNTLAFNVLAKINGKLSELAIPSVTLKKKKNAVKEFIPEGFKFVQNGKRVNDIHSATTTAMTDNAKVLLAAKLGLSFEAVSVFGYMVSVGYSVKDSLVIINQPLVREYLEAQRTKKSSVTVAEEDQNRLYTQYDVINATKLTFTDEAVDPENPRSDISVEEMIKDLKLFKSDPKSPLSRHIQEKSLQLFFELEEHSKQFQDLNRIIKLVKGVSSDFESIDKVFESEQTLFSDSSILDERTLQNLMKNKLISGNLEILHSMDKMMSKVFVERTSAFKTAFSSLLAVHKNPRFMKDTEKKKMKMDMLSNMYINAYKKLRSARPGWVTSSLSNFLVFDSTNEQLREKYVKDQEKLGNKVSEAELDKMYPTITKLYKNARKAYQEIGELKQNPMWGKNAFLDYIVASEPSSGKNYHSLEARNRVKENPIYLQRIMDSFEEMMFYTPEQGTDPDSQRINELRKEIQNFAIGSIHYLMIHDGFQYRNKSFINLIPPEYMKAFAGSSFNGISAIERVQQSLVDATKPDFKEKVGLGFYELIQRAAKLYSVHPDNGYQLFYVNTKSKGWKAVKSIGKVKGEPMVKITKDENGVEYLDINVNNQPEVDGKTMKDEFRISAVFGIEQRTSQKTNKPYMMFRPSFRMVDSQGNASVYLLSATSWGTELKAPSKDGKFFDNGFYLAPIARYVKVEQQGHRNVKNVADVDKGAPTYGQPFTKTLHGKRKKSESSKSYDLENLAWQAGIITETEQSGTDLDALLGGKQPTAPTGPIEMTPQREGAMVGLILKLKFSNLGENLKGFTNEEIKAFFSDAGMDVISDIEKAKSHLLRKLC